MNLGVVAIVKPSPHQVQQQFVSIYPVIFVEEIGCGNMMELIGLADHTHIFRMKTHVLRIPTTILI